MTPNIILSDEIRSIFPKSENHELEIATLEKALIEEGCRDNLIASKDGTLVDGYRRFEICEKHGIQYNVTYMDFPSIEDAKGWAVKNQLERRNLTGWEAGLMTITYRQDHYKKLAEENLKLSKGRGEKGRKDVDLPFTKVDVNTELAREAGLSRDTIVKIKYIMKNGNDNILESLDSNKTSVSRAYTTLQKLQKAQVKAKKNQIRSSYTNELSDGVTNQVLCMDVFKGLELIGEESVTLCFTSPPFNVNMQYKDSCDNRPHDEYIAWIKNVLSAIKPKLRPGGRLAFEIENTRVKDSNGKNTAIKYPIEAKVINIATDLGYIYRDTIIWNKGNIGNQSLPIGSYNPSNPCIRNTHSNVIVFSKDQLDLPCVTGEPSFLDTKYYDQLTRTVWDISVERNGFGSHCCPMPVRLAQEVIELLSYKGDLVLDVFGGSGTTAIACIRTGRQFIVIDESQTYCAEAKQRIENEKCSKVKKIA